MKSLSKVFRGMIYVLPLALFFSYYPVISFGSDGRMNFELSVPIIWLVIFDMVAGILMIKKKVLFKEMRFGWLWILLPVWLSLSVIWSLNSVRGMLTVGILWLIYFAGYGMWRLKDLFDEQFRMRFWKWFLGSALFACGWCVLQCILDIAGLSREYTLMCAGCTYHMFGFPHPNGFAIEPQFMGNLLLAPTILVAWLLVKKQDSKNLKRLRSRGVVFTTAKSDSAWYSSTRSSSVAVVKTTTGSLFLGFRFLLSCFFIITTTLFLTFSRGAIYAFVVGMVFLGAFVIAKNRKNRGAMVKRVGVVCGAVVLAFLFALNLQGIMSAVSPTNDTYGDGVVKVLNHLSLGVIDVKNDKTDETDDGVDEDVVEDFGEESVFDGYVAESTNIRVKLNETALETWSSDFRTMVFGVGLGGAGQAMYEKGLTASPKEIVQNQYVSLLLESGIVGIILFVLTIILIVKTFVKTKWSGGLLALLVAYGVSLCFFAGLPNALQIYLLLVLFMALWSSPVED